MLLIFIGFSKYFHKTRLLLIGFHVVQLANQAVNTIREQIMQTYEQSSSPYRLLKFHWRLFLKNSSA
ncbi:hypothetical protein DS830_04845 [Bombilactobacillus bombi]|uniref:transposase n=1 Tax=Bombilactobacillus bombi TaxID=1303590 RepID=UPI000E5706A8|nr:hypothetical protein DS830_04845 [Bombilactobacillus bombi]